MLELRSLPRIVAALAWLTLAPLGCRAILGIQDHEFDPSLADAGDGGQVALTCAFYCDTMQAACIGKNKQYPDMTQTVCLDVCKTFPPGTLQDSTGNTLGCRINRAIAARSAPELGTCVAAGLSGDGVCGTPCESYCTTIRAVCTTDFESVADCMNACAPLTDTHDYHFDDATTPDDPSLQCRLYHLSVATTDMATHCPHAKGTGKCVAPVPDGGGADGG